MSNTHNGIFLADENGNLKEYGNTGGGSSSGGHTIVDASGTEMPTESKLQFGEGFLVTDDSTNGQTIVDVKGITVVSATLLSANWSGSSQTITVSGMTSNANGEVGLPSSAISAQRSAARDARLAPTAQGTNSLTITADGTVPSIDIPIEVMIY